MNSEPRGPTTSVAVGEPTALFDGELMTAAELTDATGRWTVETDDYERVTVAIGWNAEFFTHASATVAAYDDTVSLDLRPSDRDGGYRFAPVTTAYDFAVELVWDDPAPDAAGGRGGDDR